MFCKSWFYIRICNSGVLARSLITRPCSLAYLRTVTKYACTILNLKRSIWLFCYRSTQYEILLVLTFSCSSKALNPFSNGLLVKCATRLHEKRRQKVADWVHEKRHRSICHFSIGKHTDNTIRECSQVRFFLPELVEIVLKSTFWYISGFKRDAGAEPTRRNLLSYLSLVRSIDIYLQV